MGHHRIVFAACLIIAVLPPSSGELQGRPAGGRSDEAPVGDWRGLSACVVRPSACNDEDSLYHFARLENKPGRYSLKADKIENGKSVTMGTVECIYDGEIHSLECRFPRGILQLNVQGSTMQGTMKLPDGTLWRKLSLKKAL
jgi:hypothetical protein